MYYAYILKDNNGEYYKGCTSDLKPRYQRHIKGNVPATANNLPCETDFLLRFQG